MMTLWPLRLAAFLDLNNLVGDEPMRLAVYPFGRFLVGRFDQAEHRAVVFVEPVFEVLHPILLLDLKIRGMSSGNGFGR